MKKKTVYGISEFRKNFKELLDRVTEGKEHIYISRYGKIIAVLVPVEEFDALDPVPRATSFQ